MFDRKLALAIERLVHEKGVLGLVTECNILGEGRNSFIYSSEEERDKHQKHMENEGWERQEDKPRYTLYKCNSMNISNRVNNPVKVGELDDVNLHLKRDIRVYYAVYTITQSTNNNRTRLVEILEDVEKDMEEQRSWFD